VQFKLKLKYKGEQPSVTVTRYIFNCEGFMSMAADLQHAMALCEADRAKITDGYATAKFTNSSGLFDMPYTDMARVVAQRLIDAARQKSDFAKSMDATQDLMMTCQEELEETLCPDCRRDCKDAGHVTHGEGRLVAKVAESE
jgi:hypothetical protein